MPFKKIPINNYSFNEWRAEDLKSKFSGAALTVYSSHQHNYQVEAAEREKSLIFGSKWERRFWLCGPALHDTLEFSLRVQLRKRTCFGAWLWQWWKAKEALKGRGKVNLTDTVGHLCQFPHCLPQPMSIIWPTRQKLPWQYPSSSHSLPVQLLGLALWGVECWACQFWQDFTERFPFNFALTTVEPCEFFMTVCLNPPLPMLAGMPVLPANHFFMSCLHFFVLLSSAQPF